MNEFISKLQKDLKGLQDAIKKDSDELIGRVKSYANKENLVAAGAEVEKLLEKRLKKLEPTINKVVSEIRKNALKAGFNVDELESKVRSNVSKAAATFREVADKQGFTKAAKRAAVKARSVAKKARSKTAAKKPAKAKSPSTKAASRKTRTVAVKVANVAKKK
jgi:hypothetical protein